MKMHGDKGDIDAWKSVLKGGVIIILLILLSTVALTGCIEGTEQSPPPEKGLSSLLPSTDLPEDTELIAVIDGKAGDNNVSVVFSTVNGSESISPMNVTLVQAVEGFYSTSGTYDLQVWIVEAKSDMDASAAYRNFINNSRFQTKLQHVERISMWVANGRQLTEVRDISPTGGIRYIYVWKEGDLLFVVWGNEDREKSRELASLLTSTALNA